MTDQTSYLCRSCGKRHDGLPFSYGSVAPAYWRDELADDGRSVLDDEVCIIQARHFFIRARILISVLDADTRFDWTVWVSLSRADFQQTVDLWTTPGRERQPPYFGWLSTELPTYQPTTLNLKARVHTQPTGTRPLVELEATDHPLAVEQRTGITTTRVQQIAGQLLHHNS